MTTLDLLIHDTNNAIGVAKYWLKDLKRANISLAEEVEHNKKIEEQLKRIQNMHDDFYKDHKKILTKEYYYELTNTIPNPTNTLGS